MLYPAELRGQGTGMVAEDASRSEREAGDSSGGRGDLHGRDPAARESGAAGSTSDLARMARSHHP